MSYLQSLLLGLLQGLTEFLPVSSSGHLTVLKNLFNLEEIPLLYDVMLHLATLCAVVLFFYKQIWELLKVFSRFIMRKQRPEDKTCQIYILALICGTVITGIMGILFKDFAEGLPVKFVAVGFLITALLLVFSELYVKKMKKQPSEKGSVSIKQGIVCGIAQGFGVLPGISRSGSTISGALFSGMNRGTAGEFSFILSIPAILGAFLLELKDLDSLVSAVSLPVVLIGCLAAFLSGLLALKILMKIVKKGRLGWFAVYLIPLGIFCLIFF